VWLRLVTQEDLLVCHITSFYPQCTGSKTVREIAEDAVMAGGELGNTDTITQLENQLRCTFFFPSTTYCVHSLCSSAHDVLICMQTATVCRVQHSSIVIMHFFRVFLSAQSRSTAFIQNAVRLSAYAYELVHAVVLQLVERATLRQWRISLTVETDTQLTSSAWSPTKKLQDVSTKACIAQHCYHNVCIIEHALCCGTHSACRVICTVVTVKLT
jgi:hypothetical protein